MSLTLRPHRGSPLQKFPPKAEAVAPAQSGGFGEFGGGRSGGAFGELFRRNHRSIDTSRADGEDAPLDRTEPLKNHLSDAAAMLQKKEAKNAELSAKVEKLEAKVARLQKEEKGVKEAASREAASRAAAMLRKKEAENAKLSAQLATATAEVENLQTAVQEAARRRVPIAVQLPEGLGKRTVQVPWDATIGHLKKEIADTCEKEGHRIDEEGCDAGDFSLYLDLVGTGREAEHGGQLSGQGANNNDDTALLDWLMNASSQRYDQTGSVISVPCAAFPPSSPAAFEGDP